MTPVAHLALSPTENAKLTPLEMLADFADATRGWVYMERDSRHYAKEKGRSALVLRHWREDAPAHVDFAFATVPDNEEEVELVLLDAPDAESPLSQAQRTELVELFLDVLRNYLSDRPDHVTLRIERDQTDQASA